MRAPGQEPWAGPAKRGAAGGFAEGGKQDRPGTSYLHQEPGPFRMEVLNLGLGWEPIPQSMAQGHLGEKPRGWGRFANMPIPRAHLSQDRRPEVWKCPL